MIASQELAESLVRLRKVHIAATIPTPLATFLYIYNHSQRECYLDYMEGARVLAKYLAPIEIPRIQATAPDMLVSYELQELAKVLQPHLLVHHNTIQIENAIYEYLTQSR